VRGDDYTAANLFFRAYQARPTVKNRFNLAAAYASIGKVDIAIQMYTDLVADGEFTHFSEVHSYEGRSYEGGARQTRAFNVSDESRVRLAGLRRSDTTASIGAGADAGTGFTDEEARALDIARKNVNRSATAP
jgi:hypothetical protein